MKLYIIDGNIGSGKSTFLKHISDVFPNIITIQEPVDEWFKIKDENGMSLFELFYKDPNRFCYVFQTNILYSRFQKIKKLMEPTKENENKIVVCERSIMTDMHVFVEAARELNTLSSVEYEVFKNWFTMLLDLSKFKVDGYIYIRCDPKISHQRIIERNRKGEEEIAFDYLELLHKKHELWFCDEPNTFIIDGNRNISELKNDNDLHKSLEVMFT